MLTGHDFILPIFMLGLIALLGPYFFKSCDFDSLTNKNTKQSPMYWMFGSFGPQIHI